MGKLYSSRLIPLLDTVLVRKVGSVPAKLAVPRLLIAEKSDKGNIEVTEGPQAKSRAIVVAVGPGEERNGVWVKPDERIKPGATILADARTYIQFSDVPEWKEEGLWFISAAHILFIEVVEPARNAVHA